MKNLILIIVFVFINTLFLSCSPQFCLQKRTDRGAKEYDEEIKEQSCLQKRTDRLIEKSQRVTDTVFLFNVSFNNLNFVWYQKNNFLHAFVVKPHNIVKFKPIEVKIITLNLNNDSINKYFDSSFYKDVPCFNHAMDGAMLELYIKNKEPVSTSVNMSSLFKTKFSSNTFPYKLQYDFFKIGLCPKGYNFEKMYLEQ